MCEYGYTIHWYTPYTIHTVINARPMGPLLSTPLLISIHTFVNYPSIHFCRVSPVTVLRVLTGWPALNHRNGTGLAQVSGRYWRGWFCTEPVILTGPGASIFLVIFRNCPLHNYRFGHDQFVITAGVGRGGGERKFVCVFGSVKNNVIIAVENGVRRHTISFEPKNKYSRSRSTPSNYTTHRLYYLYYSTGSSYSLSISRLEYQATNTKRTIFALI